jgi:DNA invertase Pin-like site-specific DNA recombinase
MNPSPHPPALKTAAIYRRVSTDHQSGSLDVQEERIAAYLTLKGLTATDATTFADEATSGGIAIWERPGGKQLMAVLEHGLPSGKLAMEPTPITHLVVAKLDRLGRRSRDWHNFIHWLDEHAITLHIVDLQGDSFTNAGPFGKFMLGILAECAELERAMICDRTQQRVDSKFAKGELIGTVPYGWQVLERDGTKLLEPLPTEAYWVRWIHERHDRDRLKPGTIAGMLNEREVPTKTGKVGGWQTGNVKKLLANRHTAKLLSLPLNLNAPN